MGIPYESTRILIDCDGLVEQLDERRIGTCEWVLNACHGRSVPEYERSERFCTIAERLAAYKNARGGLIKGRCRAFLINMRDCGG